MTECSRHFFQLECNNHWKPKECNLLFAKSAAENLQTIEKPIQ